MEQVGPCIKGVILLIKSQLPFKKGVILLIRSELSKLKVDSLHVPAIESKVETFLFCFCFYLFVCLFLRVQTCRKTKD